MTSCRGHSLTRTRVPGLQGCGEHRELPHPSKDTLLQRSSRLRGPGSVAEAAFQAGFPGVARTRSQGSEQGFSLLCGSVTHFLLEESEGR